MEEYKIYERKPKKVKARMLYDYRMFPYYEIIDQNGEKCEMLKSLFEMTFDEVTEDE